MERSIGTGGLVMEAVFGISGVVVLGRGAGRDVLGRGVGLGLE